jgi:hypothetical protein
LGGDLDGVFLDIGDRCVEQRVVRWYVVDVAQNQQENDHGSDYRTGSGNGVETTAVGIHRPGLPQIEDFSLTAFILGGRLGGASEIGIRDEFRDGSA